ncbi:hypothetical protein [Flavobacterium taihuense]|uniref:Uncharacterized protein n=1 Tax=Flavobacterium taihuense TaxID=2857508 RepID=A0ABS6XY37_9FLAO|nr:hypothetical protein [Flavobacterium taihuense]MBW4361601.1 hypothetical protein [Flavobacterium taihuense]
MQTKLTIRFLFSFGKCKASSGLMTNEFLVSLSAAGVSDLNPVEAIMGQNIPTHNQEEILLFAKDI